MHKSRPARRPLAHRQLGHNLALEQVLGCRRHVALGPLLLGGHAAAALGAGAAALCPQRVRRLERLGVRRLLARRKGGHGLEQVGLVLGCQRQPARHATRVVPSAHPAVYTRGVAREAGREAGAGRRLGGARARADGAADRAGGAGGSRTGMVVSVNHGRPGGEVIDHGLCAAGGQAGASRWLAGSGDGAGGGAAAGAETARTCVTRMSPFSMCSPHVRQMQRFSA